MEYKTHLSSARAVSGFMRLFLAILCCAYNFHVLLYFSFIILHFSRVQLASFTLCAQINLKCAYMSISIWLLSISKIKKLNCLAGISDSILKGVDFCGMNFFIKYTL